MNIQLLIVIVIGVTVGIILLRKLYEFFFTKKDASFCGGCKACDLGEIQRENRKLPEQQ